MAFTNNREAVTAIFIGYFDRAPAPNGLNSWVNDIENNGASVEDVARAFATQPEAQGLYPALGEMGSTTTQGNIDFVTAVFQNLFDRDPNFAADGSNFWVTKLEDGADIGQLIIEIIAGAQGADLELIENKIEVGLAYANAAEAADVLMRDPAGDTILDGVTAADASVATAQAAIDAQFPTEPVVVPGNTINLNPDAAVISGTAGNDVFQAETGDLTSSIQIDGGAGTDALSVFNEESGVAVSPRTENVEQFYMTNQANDLTSVADNNVGGYNNNGQASGGVIYAIDGDRSSSDIMIDVEIDAGRMVGVNRWEDFDSRADLVIEDARDDTPEDGTFTAEQTVAMVSTDPGNVDFAVYFDDPTNTSVSNSSLFVEVIDQENAQTFSAAGVTPTTTGVLTESRLESFSFTVNGEEVTIDLPDSPDVFGATATYQSLTAAIQTALNNDEELQALGQSLTATLLTQTFDEAASLDNAGTGTIVFGLQIEITAPQGVDLVATNTDSSAVDPNTDIAARVTSATVQTSQLISLNVELDDVGKGSTGGDAMFGAMSTGRQTGDDATSDSIGIQQFDIAVDRSSALQTINSTNNALEVVNITNREQTGINNTTNASDEASGDLAVRGQANPGVVTTSNGPTVNGSNGIATDGAMPGAVPQHNAFGFSDVRAINAGTMTGALDITAELTEEIVEKYLNIVDSGPNGETDDRDFVYTLGNGNDEFLLNMSSDALTAAGTGSREDFDLAISGGNGDDVITTNIGGNVLVDGLIGLVPSKVAGALKVIDEQGNDHYELTSDNVLGWYENSVSNVAANFVVSGGDGADTIWTHGWGDFTINDGAGADVVYTDNSGATQISDSLETNIDRNILENDQIDYVFGAAWAFNAEFVGPQAFDTTGVTNDRILIGSLATSTTALTSGTVDITVDYFGAGGSANAATAYSVTVTIPVSEMILSAGNVFVTDQAINQAVKRAVNDTDAVMSNMLEAADGPGNSLAVYTKSDGAHVATDFAISIGNVVLNNGTPSTTIPTTGQAVFDNAYAGTANSSTQGQLFEATVSNDDSNAESDNLINVAGDGASDLFVLSTDDSVEGQPTALSGSLGNLTDLNGASNEVLAFDNGFGTDTVLNFDAAGATSTLNGVDGAEDVLDFDALFADNTFAASGLIGSISAPIVDGFITVVAESTTVNDSQAAIQTLYTGFDNTASTGTREEIVIVYDNVNDNNAGAVYSVVDGAAANDVQVTFEGTINLIGTDWTALTLDNFA